MINSIKNAVNVLNCFSDDSLEIGITELAVMLNMNKSTLHHIVKALYNEGILVRTVNRKYRLSSKMLNWGELVTKQYSPYYDAIPYLNELAEVTNETVHLGVQENDNVSFLVKIQPKLTVKIQTAIGDRKPLYCTGLGKALLSSNYKSSEVQDLKFEKFTRNTISTPEKLLKELETVKLQGYAIDNEEFEEGLFCIATPVRDFMGNVVCAISISGPEFRMVEKKERLIKQLHKTEKRISNDLDFYL